VACGAPGGNHEHAMCSRGGGEYGCGRVEEGASGSYAWVRAPRLAWPAGRGPPAAPQACCIAEPAAAAGCSPDMGQPKQAP
jgi:hypothetical protein